MQFQLWLSHQRMRELLSILQFILICKYELRLKFDFNHRVNLTATKEWTSDCPLSKCICYTVFPWNGLDLALNLPFLWFLVPSNRCFNSIWIPTTNQYERGTHKRTYRIRSNVHSRISSTQNSVYSIYFYKFQEKIELDLHEIDL